MKQTIENTAHTEPNGEILLPIGEVSALTGVNAVTLRAWQRRFGLVIPARTPKGHRLYTSENIQEIHEINAWLAKGVAISKVKPLLMSAAKSSFTEIVQTQAIDLWCEQVTALNTALFDFNQHKLQQILDDAFGLYPFQLVKEKLLQPWLNQLEDLVNERLDAELIIAWLKSELLNRVGGRHAFNGQAVTARIAVADVSHEEVDGAALLALVGDDHWPSSRRSFQAPGRLINPDGSGGATPAWKSSGPSNRSQ